MSASKFFLFFNFVLFSSTAFAQEVFKFNSSGGGFNVFVGRQSYDPTLFFSDSKPVTNLSKAIEFDSISATRWIKDSAIFSRPSRALTLFGFQGYGLYNSVLMGGEFNLGLASATTGGGIHRYDSASAPPKKLGETYTQPFCSNLLFNIGLIALRKKGLTIYPIAGAGWGLTGVRLKSSGSVNGSNRNIYPEIANVVTDKNRQNMFAWVNNAVADIGIGLNYYIGRSTEDNAKGVCIGIRTGYNHQFASNNLKINEFLNVRDGIEKSRIPDVGSSTFYVKVLFGFGRVGENL